MTCGPQSSWLRNSDGHVVVVERHVVDVDAAVDDPDRVAFPRDHPLDEHLFRVERVVEHDDVARPRLADLVDQLVHDQAIVILERRRHAQPVDARDLKAERHDERGVDRRGDAASAGRRRPPGPSSATRRRSRRPARRSARSARPATPRSRAWIAWPARPACVLRADGSNVRSVSACSLIGAERTQNTTSVTADPAASCALESDTSSGRSSEMPGEATLPTDSRAQNRTVPCLEAARFAGPSARRAQLGNQLQTGSRTRRSQACRFWCASCCDRRLSRTFRGGFNGSSSNLNRRAGGMCGSLHACRRRTRHADSHQRRATER